MANIIDYLDWFGDFDFETVPFNEADNLILAQLAYLDWSGVLPLLSVASVSPVVNAIQTETPDRENAPQDIEVARGIAQGRDSVPRAESSHLFMPLSQAAARFRRLHPNAEKEDIGPLLSHLTPQLLERMVSAGKRFAALRLGCYRRMINAGTREQFAAFTALLPDGTVYISYEGTDDSLIGWIEDCEMSYRIVASQSDALRYLEEAACVTSGTLRVGGHSKGGNLAAFAAALCASGTQERIAEVWCNDSPGFVDEVVPLAAIESIKPKIRLYTPEFSVVGSLFDHVVEPVIVKSSESGVMQHNALAWQIMRGDFVRGSGVSAGGKRADAAFQRLIASHDLAGRKRLLDGLYEGLSEAGVTKIGQMLANGPAGIAAMLGSVQGLEGSERQVITEFLTGILLSTLADAFEPVARQIHDALSRDGD